MRRVLPITVGAGVLALLFSTTAAAGPAATVDHDRGDRPNWSAAAEHGIQLAPVADPGTKPRSANPYLSLLPDPSKADYIGWRRVLEAEAKVRARKAGARDGGTDEEPQPIDETEPTDERGHNDTLETADRADGFGTGRRDNPRAELAGELAPQPVEVADVASSDHPHGAIPAARRMNLAPGAGVRTEAVIGDGPHGSRGSGSGDFDFYRIDLEAGQTLTVDLDVADSSLEPAIVLYDEGGKVVRAAQNLTGVPADTTRLAYLAESGGTHYVSVGSATPWPHPIDPFDAASGAGVGTEGPYGITLRSFDADADVFAVDLRAGDVLGATVRAPDAGAQLLEVYGPDGDQVHGSAADLSAIYPAAAPLPGGGNATLEHVAVVSGTHYLAVTDGAGPYTVTAETYRPAGERGHRPQVLYLDFDGERINNNIFAGMATDPGVRQLSPLRAFMRNWDLRPEDEEALIDQIVRQVTQRLEHAADHAGRSTRVVVRNSKDHPDLFGKPGVSRVIVGGTVEEAGILPVIGVSQSIDPGNFERAETALVLLDTMSDSAQNPASINAYLAEESDRVAAVGNALGNVVAHEAGHFLGSWHTHNSNGVANIMDTGHILDLYQVGQDGIAGTDDDIDVRFVADHFEPLQGFTGLEDTRARTAYALVRRPLLGGRA